MILTLFLQYWVRIAIVTGMISIVGGVFYARKVIKERAYKHRVSVKQKEFKPCIDNAITEDDFDECFKKAGK